MHESIGTLSSARAGIAVFSATSEPRSLTPWTGYSVLLASVGIALFAGTVLPTRRDA